MTSRTEQLLEQLRDSAAERVRNDRLCLADHEGQGVLEVPLVVRQALATRLLLQEVPLSCVEAECLVGCRPTMPFPEFATEAEKARVAHLGIGPETQFSHVVPGFDRVLRLGFEGLAAQAAGQLRTTQSPRLAQVAFWSAAKIACEAVVAYALRYATYLRRLAADMPADATRRAELLSLADLCTRVPAGPAGGFHEALQSLWFTYAVFRTVGPCQVPLGRLDQMLYAHWQQSRRAEGLTDERALGLLRQFYIKLESADYLCGDWRDADNGTSITVGGVDADGREAVNELTYLCLAARIGLPLRTPTFSVRVGRQTPSALYEAAFAVIRSAPGSLAFHSDEAIIPALHAAGMETADARDWACQGCVEPLIPGRSGDHMIGVWLELLKYLELALNDGQPIRTGDGAPEQTRALLSFGARMDTGDTSGPPTGDAATLERAGFPALLSAYKAQLRYAIERKARECNEIMTNIPAICPTPLLSATFEDCMRRGLDRTEGGCKYYFTGTACRGLANVANALAAIERLVYEERRLALPDLVGVLKKDFMDGGAMRQELKHRAPKFGNDDDRVDGFARELAAFCAETILAQRNPFGFPYKPGLWASWYHTAGRQIAATPDGRRAGESIAPNCSPAAGTALLGPTAVINSVTKIDFAPYANGMALDLSLPAAMFAPGKGDGTHPVEALVRTYVALGGMQVQFNLYDRDTLLLAQEDPEEHRDLLVRVWGFSAFFVTLDKEIQDQIVARS